MVIADPESISCEIYEIKHSDKIVPEQYKNLIDDNKVEATEFRYGKVTKRTVIYRGQNAMDGDICYVNVEDYLKALDI